jgi:hypothetical protein
VKRVLCLALGALLAGACGDSESAPPRSPESTPGSPAPGNFEGRAYERNFVFTTLGGDSAFLVPWLISSRTRPGAVDRHARGWLFRGSAWDAFYDESWETAPTRTPWRLLPHGSLRLIVGEGDAIEGVLFTEGARELHLELSSLLTEWTGPRGQVFRIQEAAIYLSDQRLPGIALEMSRVHTPDPSEAGDWAFLTSGDSLQVVLESQERSEPRAGGAFRGWARLDFRDLQWPALTLDWAELRAFRPARQDVPVSWTIASDEGDVEGNLSVQSAQLQAGQGPGPMLPVEALFVVTGELRLEGGSYPVQGLFRLTRP